MVEESALSIAVIKLAVKFGRDELPKGTCPFAVNPPSADMTDFSSTKRRARSLCAAAGRAVMYAGGAVGIAFKVLSWTYSR